jgi:hypothetical protein
MMTPPLMGGPFFALPDGFVHFFPGEPIGGVPEPRLARVGRAKQRWGKQDPAISLVGMVLTIFGEQRDHGHDGQYHDTNQYDQSYAHVCSPRFDTLFFLSLSLVCTLVE